MNEYRIVATGHRPHKLLVDGEPPYEGAAYEYLARFAEQTLRGLLEEAGGSPLVLVTGMALGWDQATADAAYLLGIKYDAFVPFYGFEERWSKTCLRRYEDLLSAARHVVTVSEGGFSNWKLMKRNEAMIDYGLQASGRGVLALWDGSTGGTYNTVQYARRRGLVVGNVWEKWLEWQAFNRKGRSAIPAATQERSPR